MTAKPLFLYFTFIKLQGWQSRFFSFWVVKGKSSTFRISRSIKRFKSKMVSACGMRHATWGMRHACVLLIITNQKPINDNQSETKTQHFFVAVKKAISAHWTYLKLFISRFKVSVSFVASSSSNITWSCRFRWCRYLCLENHKGVCHMNPFEWPCFHESPIVVERLN